MNRNEFLNQYWRYYESLEEDFIKTIRYVSLEEENFNTYSIEYSRLLQAICSEIDVVLKELSSKDGDEKTNIAQYYKYIEENRPTLINEEVKVIKFLNLKLYPLKNWTQKDSPTWWSSHNKIKHNRNEKMIYANLENVLNSLSALYLLENVLLLETVKGTSEMDIMDDDSKIFDLNWDRKYMKNIMAFTTSSFDE